MRNRKVWLEPKFCGSNIIKINKWLFQVFYFKMIFESTVNLLACYLIFKSLYNTFSLSLSLFFVTAKNNLYNCCWVALFCKVFFSFACQSISHFVNWTFVGITFKKNLHLKSNIVHQQLLSSFLFVSLSHSLNSTWISLTVGFACPRQAMLPFATSWQTAHKSWKKKK